MSRGMGGRLLLVAAVAAIAWFAQDRFDDGGAGTPPAGRGVATAPAGTDAILAEAYESRRDSLQVGGRGTVSRLLADDNDGSRHQRFILRLASGQTVLVAHNIDLAPRIDGLRVGDTVEFSGEFEWNEQGGVVHWTHHDPRGTHAAGWLRHGGQTYQ